MKHALLLLAFIAAPAIAGPPLNFSVEVTKDHAPKVVTVMERQFDLGQGSGWHIHHGTEMVYIAEGEIELRVGTEAPRVLRAGDSVQIPREMPHTATNIGQVPVKLIITYVTDSGSDLRTPVDAPAAN
ncbi:cupin domain-containing protein [Asticcacaulis biprosthecium]|nr:cupin domain-containing protein [Asticcacaulis biprosthecium]